MPALDPRRCSQRGLTSSLAVDRDRTTAARAVMSYTGVSRERIHRVWKQWVGGEMAFFVLYYGYIQHTNDGPIEHAVTAFEAYPSRADAEASLKKTADTAERLGLQVPDVTIVEGDAIAEVVKRVTTASTPSQWA
jgi:nucleotide-binding universal stress UspA family protein